jgi:Type IV secretion system pilin
MKKIIALLSPAIYFSLTASAFADNGLCDPNGQFKSLCNLTSTNFAGFIGSIIQLIFVLAVIVALLYLIYGGFRWLVSGGDKTQVGAAREHIVAAVIGLVIIFLSYFILNLILTFFNIGSLSTLTIPVIPH